MPGDKSLRIHPDQSTTARVALAFMGAKPHSTRHFDGVDFIRFDVVRGTPIDGEAFALQIDAAKPGEVTFRLIPDPDFGP